MQEATKYPHIFKIQTSVNNPEMGSYGEDQTHKWATREYQANEGFKTKDVKFDREINLPKRIHIPGDWKHDGGANSTIL